ncbi:hypothetical protein [Mesorhizobium sp. M0047]|uniref:hypothetical protein n=1 Tax=Mesorhizobium sp. M0047 TaxID=2956859 RepID=UPI0033375AFF
MIVIVIETCNSAKMFPILLTAIGLIESLLILLKMPSLGVPSSPRAPADAACVREGLERAGLPIAPAHLVGCAKAFHPVGQAHSLKG